MPKELPIIDLSRYCNYFRTEMLMVNPFILHSDSTDTVRKVSKDSYYRGSGRGMPGNRFPGIAAVFGKTG